ncbi:Xylose isomerase [Trichinella spiralis]|uniref:Xylose isomerase n=1 Tax=Trichinella spiralis TaxID=6334 RepID=A0ABR3KHG3_TRISP
MNPSRPRWDKTGQLVTSISRNYGAGGTLARACDGGSWGNERVVRRYVMKKKSSNAEASTVVFWRAHFNAQRKAVESDRLLKLTQHVQC